MDRDRLVSQRQRRTLASLYWRSAVSRSAFPRSGAGDAVKRLDAFLARSSMGLVLVVACLLVWAALTKVHTHSWQEESRMATVQALVEQGTFVIDHTEFNRTGDKVFVDGHFYSDKTPILSVAAAGVHFILPNAFCFSLDSALL